jgi:signal peptidase I
MTKVNMNELRLNTKSVRKMVSILVTVLLICAVLMCFSVVLQVLNRGYASLGGYSFFRVVTGSMEPEIPIGALIISKQVDIDTLEIGDIVCFRSEIYEIYGQSITHRVIDISKDENGITKLQTKGDFNTAADSLYVTERNLIGKVVWWSEQNNLFSDLIAFFSNKISFLACIVFPCLVVAGLLFRNSVKNINKELSQARAELRGMGSSDPAQSPQSAQAGGGAEGAPSSAKQTDQTTTDMTASMSSREYQEMYARICAELLEELKQEYDREKPKK